MSISITNNVAFKMEHTNAKQMGRKELASLVQQMVKATGKKLRMISLPGQWCLFERYLNRVVGKKNIDYFIGVERECKKRANTEKNAPENLSVVPRSEDFNDVVNEYAPFADFNFIYADYCGNPFRDDKNLIEEACLQMKNYISKGLFGITFSLQGRDSIGGGRIPLMEQLGLDTKHAIFKSSFRDSLEKSKQDIYHSHAIVGTGHTLLCDAITMKFESMIEEMGIDANIVMHYQYQGERSYMLTMCFAVNIPEIKPVEEIYFHDDLRLHDEENEEIDFSIQKSVKYMYDNRKMSSQEIAETLGVSGQKVGAILTHHLGRGKFGEKQRNKMQEAIKAKGKRRKYGSTKNIKVSRVLKLRKNNTPWRAIAEEMGVGMSTLVKFMAENA